MPKKTIAQDENPVQDSPQKTAFREFIKKYAEQNPAKYALKKEELERKLNSL